MPRRLLARRPRLPRPHAGGRAGRRLTRSPGRPRRLAAALGVGHVELAALRRGAPVQPAAHRPQGRRRLARRPPHARPVRRPARLPRPAQLAEKLVAPRLRTASAAMRRTLRQRSRDMLSQAHLARHVLFHVYHTPAIPRHAQEIFGMSPQRYRALRDSGTTPVAIAARGGLTLDASREALRTILAKRDDQGVRSGAMSTRQARALFAEQQAGHRRLHAAPLPHAGAAGRVRLPPAVRPSRRRRVGDAGVGTRRVRRRGRGASGADPSVARGRSDDRRTP